MRPQTSPMTEPDATPAGGHSAFVLDVQRTCVHDGPGVRTVVFFRGCRLRCRWCHNPESQAIAQCGGSYVATPVGEILEAVRRDSVFYATTHGGVTLSGGEPMLQPARVLVALLSSLSADGVHVAVETAGDAPWSTFDACLPYVDSFLFDLKVVGDDAQHRHLTGRPSGTIASNFERLVARGADVHVRVTVVPGHNDSDANVDATAALLRAQGLRSVELLRYYPLHEDKARRFGVDQRPLGISAARATASLERVARRFESAGISVTRPASPERGTGARFTARVHGLKRDIRAAGYAACIETAALKTGFYRDHGFDERPAIQRAKLLRHLLGNKTVRVWPGELLVGNYTSKRVGGNVWVEYFGASMALNLYRIDRQTPVAFQITRDEKVRFYRDILPFWIERGLIGKVFDGPLALAGFAARLLDKRAGFENNLAAIAHFVVRSERILALGTIGIAAELRERLGTCPADRRPFYEGALIAIEALELFAARYAAELEREVRAETDAVRRRELQQMAEVCRHVPRNPARTFHEALQAILLLHVALCTESFENAISFGRLDRILQPYFEADLAAGRIDRDRARELLACFVLKIDEVVLLNDGDTMFQLGKLFESLSAVETITFGGVDGAGRDATNDVTHLLLDTCELRPIGVNMAARVHAASPPELLERIAEVYLGGSPMPELFNDDVYVDALVANHPSTLEEARDYAIVGCVEPTASDDHFGNTDCANVNLALPLVQALGGDTRRLWDRTARDWASLAFEALRPRRRAARPPRDMDELLERFGERVSDLVRGILADHARIERALAEHFPTPLASTLSRGALASGLDVYDGGATHNTSGIQAVGVTDVADSLAALDAVVFRQRLFSLEEVLAAVEADFVGARGEHIREALLAVPKFGDDGATEALFWLHRVLDVFVDALAAADHATRGGRYVAGYYGLNVSAAYGRKTPALPSGRRSGTPLANSLCPHHGMRRVDLTSTLNAVARVDFRRFAPNGATLTSTIDSGLFPGREGVRNLAGLIRGFFDQGGMQLQPNLVSREVLLDAFQNPGTHPDLVVRIAGYCGRFDELSDELKREIIERTYYSSGSQPPGGSIPGTAAPVPRRRRRGLSALRSRLRRGAAPWLAVDGARVGRTAKTP